MRVHVGFQPLQLHLHVGSYSFRLKLEHIEASPLVMLGLHCCHILHVVTQVITDLSHEALRLAASTTYRFNTLPFSDELFSGFSIRYCLNNATLRTEQVPGAINHGYVYRCKAAWLGYHQVLDPISRPRPATLSSGRPPKFLRVRCRHSGCTFLNLFDLVPFPCRLLLRHSPEYFLPSAQV